MSPREWLLLARDVAGLVLFGVFGWLASWVAVLGWPEVWS